MTDARKIKQLNEKKDEFKDASPYRLVLMVGAADFFHTKHGRSLRSNSYELLALVHFLEKIGAVNPTEEDQETLVCCFDSNYTYETIKNDIKNVNKVLFEKHKAAYRRFEDFEVSPDALNTINYGNVFFEYFLFDLETSQKKFQNVREIYSLMNQPLTKLSDECKPKENTAMQALQKLCTEIPFQEYYLYNCAWIGGFTGFADETTGEILGTSAKQNRHFENMCELLYIFQHLQKPAYLLTAPDMLAYTHKNQKQVGSLYVTPLNSTTKFIKENWSTKKGGKSRKLKKSKKVSKSRKWRKGQTR